MPKQLSREEMSAKVRIVERKIADGVKLAEACKEVGATKATYFRWVGELVAETERCVGSSLADHEESYAELVAENGRLRVLIAEAEVDTTILRDAIEGFTKNPRSARSADLKDDLSPEALRRGRQPGETLLVPNPRSGWGKPSKPLTPLELLEYLEENKSELGSRLAVSLFLRHHWDDYPSTYAFYIHDISSEPGEDDGDEETTVLSIGDLPHD